MTQSKNLNDYVPMQFDSLIEHLLTQLLIEDIIEGIKFK